MEVAEKKTINILGSCVSRDTFGMFEDDGGFDIQRCVTNSSIFSLCSPKLYKDLSLTENDFPNSRHNFQKRCAALDISKKVFEYIKEIESDFLIIDLGNLISRKIIKVRKKDCIDEYDFTYITLTKALEENLELLDNIGIEVLETFLAFEDELSMVGFMYQYAEMIKENFDEDKVIIIEITTTERYVSDDGEIKLFRYGLDKMDAKKHCLALCYEILKNALPNAHVIKLPCVEIMANYNHKWGINLLHYVTEFYEYLLKCVRVIAYNSNREYEEILLEDVRTMFEQLINERYGSITDGQYTLRNTSSINSRFVKYGSKVIILPSAEGGHGQYTFSVFVKKKYDSKWRKVNVSKNNIAVYKPTEKALYDVCVKVKDMNNVEKKVYLEFIVR